ncbi:MAG TPA: DUF3800 domain-containing protein [Candidatus Dormibacteraeota bacterium]|nr:DUF3800 domain-containing protein [Candidatus Dormibacteraeota bacterium]
MASKESSPEELERTRDARVSKRRLDKQESYLSLLQLAARLRQDNEFAADPGLRQALDRGEGERQTLAQQVGGRIVPRRRPTAQQTTTTCTVFVDECGSHSLAANDSFGAFVLAAVLIRDADHLTVSREWRRWKRNTFGSSKIIVHEPDFRQGLGPFGGSIAKRQQLKESLDRIIDQLPFAAVACVINRADYRKWLGDFKSPDISLPAHPYLMSLDFLMERLLMVLENDFGGARASVVVEARGPKEDAALQYEFARLHLDGTTYIAPTWFRQRLPPGMLFRTKKDTLTGLELADLLARPCGEKVLNPTSTPDRWPVFRTKLCLGQETKHSILGLKILPWDDRYKEIWKS